MAMVRRLFCFCLLLTGTFPVFADSVPLVMVKTAEPVEVIDLSTLEGKPGKLAFADKKLTLVHFWATWCKPCQEELPLLLELSRRYQGKGVHFVTVATDSHDAVRQYLKKYPMDLPVLIDQYGSAMHRYKVRGLPSSYVVDARGKIRFQAMGMVNWRLPIVDRQLGSLLLE